MRFSWKHGADSFDNLSPRQQNDLMFAHTIGRLDFELDWEPEPELASVSASGMPDLNTPEFRKLSPKQKRLIMQPVRGGAINTVTWAAAGLTTSITTYSVGDILGTEKTITNCALNSGKSGTVLSAGVFDNAKVTGAINYFLSNAALAGVGADNAAWTITDTQTSIVGMIPFPTPYASALNSYGEVTNLGLSYTTTTSTSSLFGDGVTLTANAVFGAATDLGYMAAILFD